METRRCVVTGLGNIGRRFLEVLQTRGTLLKDRYGFQLEVVGVADSSGAFYAPEGIALDKIIALKERGHRLRDGAFAGRMMDTLAMVSQCDATFLIEATPTNIQTGQPGLDYVRTALKRGLHCVLASKGPLVLAYAELAAMTDVSGPGKPALRFSGAVGGALPSINIGRRDLAGSRITRVEAILNGTTQVILGLMAQGQPFEAALASAQQMGIVEPDPSLDVDGWDAANKLVIVANAVLRQPTTLADLHVTGIRNVTVEQMKAARSAGGTISLVGSATLSGGDTSTGQYALEVKPTHLPPGHPFARLELGEMGILYQSDVAGRTVATSLEDGPWGTCAAMLRDVIEIVGQGHGA
ncbi:MAG: homoserine dehydrogenase [Herpetosiphon sp.]